jgi:acyl carrier protein
MTEIESRVCQLVADAFQVPVASINLQSSATTVETWDSVNLLHLLFAIEGEFSVTILPDEISALQSVAGILELLRRKSA